MNKDQSSKTGTSRMPDGRQRVIVLKFGASVLRRTEDYRQVVAEIYRHMREGYGVVAVVSALAGETDALIRKAAGFGAEDPEFSSAALLATGEIKSAALLALACEQAGIQADFLDIRSLAFTATGAPLAATPVSLDVRAIEAALDDQKCVIIPGYYARNEEGKIVLLGRGGSDLTAAVLAQQLGLDAAHLIKDVDGVYDCDPAQHAGTAKKYEALTWSTALAQASALVQPQALEYAQKESLQLKVGALGAATYSTIGKTEKPPVTGYEQPRVLRVALAGCGVVGSAVIDHLALYPARYEICSVLVKNVGRARGVDVAKEKFVSSVDAFMESKPDVVIDVLASDIVSHAVIEAAIDRDIPVVTACKQTLANDPSLLDRAASASLALLISAAVGGGAPMLETVERAASGNRLVSIEGVMNGTVNYILNHLRSGKTFHEALLQAQKAGLAEADASADLEGKDAVAKIILASRKAFGKTLPIDAVSTQTLDQPLIDEMRQKGGVWRQVSSAVLTLTGEVKAEVAFKRVDGDALFENLPGQANAIRIISDSGARWTTVGKGAGGVPTAHSIIADLEDIRRLKG